MSGDGDPCYVCGLAVVYPGPEWVCQNPDCRVRTHVGCAFDLVPEGTCPNARCSQTMSPLERERNSSLYARQQRQGRIEMQKIAIELEAKLTKSATERSEFYSEYSRWGDERRGLYRRIAALEAKSREHAEMTGAAVSKIEATAKGIADERSELETTIEVAIAESQVDLENTVERAIAASHLDLERMLTIEKCASDRELAEEKEAGDKKLADERSALYVKIAEERAASERALAEERASSERRIGEERAAFLAEIRARDREKDAALRALERKVEAFGRRM